MASPPEKQIENPLFSNPQDLRTWRKQLLDIPEPITISGAQYNTYWPHVVWTLKKSDMSKGSKSDKGSKRRTEYWHFRLARPTYQGQKAAPGTVLPPGRRIRRKREGCSCHATLRVVFEENGMRRMSRIVERRRGNLNAENWDKDDGVMEKKGEGFHSDDVTESNALKINSVIRGIVVAEGEKFYSSAMVFNAITGSHWNVGERKALEGAGGAYLNCQEVTNASARSRRSQLDTPSYWSALGLARAG